MDEPIVSIIIPTYNRPRILFDTINNVLNQTLTNIKIIVIDDGSSEEMREIIQSFTDGRIHYIKTEENLGCTGARLLGIQSSEGDFIAFLDDDDEWDNNYLNSQLQVFKENPSLDIVICNYEVQNVNDEVYTRNMQSFTTNFKQMIHKQTGPFFQCCMFRRGILDNSEELMDNHSIPSEDWDFFMNLSMRNPSVGYSPQMGFKWKYTQSSQSANFLLEAKSLDYIIQKHHNSIVDLCGYIILSDHYFRKD